MIIYYVYHLPKILHQSFPQNLDYTHMQVVKSLESLDLSRNSITSIPPGTFRDQSALKYLDLSLNSLRTVRILNLALIFEYLINCSFSDRGRCLGRSGEPANPHHQGQQHSACARQRFGSPAAVDIAANGFQSCGGVVR